MGHKALVQFLPACRTDLLDKQLSQLNGEIKEVTSDIKQLCARLDSERNTSSNDEVKERISKLEQDEIELIAQHGQLLDKLQPGGIPSEGLKNSILIFCLLSKGQGLRWSALSMFQCSYF